MAFILVGLVYNVTIPLFEPPDEIWHFAFADYLASGERLPRFSASHHKPVFLREAGQPPLYYAITALAIAPLDRGDFPDFVRFNMAHPSITPGATSDRPNVFVHTRYEDWPYRGAVLAVHVARLVSLIFGLVTVLGAYAIARQVVPARPGLAIAAAAIVAFTPQFVLLSNAVNNDSLMAATATWTVWASIRFRIGNEGLLSPRLCSGQGRWAVALGAILGLALLSKLSAIVLLPFVGLAIFITWLCNLSRFAPSTSLRARFHALRFTFYVSLLMFVTAFLIAGWWYVRNVVLYGDPLAWQVWLSDIGVREPAPTPWQLLPEVPALFRTYWIEFTYGQPVPWLWAILTLVTLIAIGGCLTIAARWISDFKGNYMLRRSTQYVSRSNLQSPISNLLLLLAWLALIVIGVIRYMQTTPAAQGRLLFPAIAVISLLLAAGLSAWRANWLAYGLAGGLFVLTLTAPFIFVRPAFARPVVSSLPADATLSSARFGEAVELIAYRLPARRVSPGEALRVTTYWRARELILRDQRLLIRLLRADSQSGGQAHFILGTSLYPTTLWLPGQIIVDEHTVRADDSLEPGAILHLQLGVGDEVTPMLPVEGSLAWFTGDVADLGELEVVAR